MSARGVTLLGALGILLASPVGPHAGTLGAGDRTFSLTQLAGQLAAPDMAARVRARQMLPREGAEAVAYVLPYLAHHDAPIWRNAHAVLQDIFHRTDFHGRDPHRARAVAALMERLAPEHDEALRLRVLRLAPVALGPDDDLKPIAAMLREEALPRERARAALVEIGGPAAADALREAVQDAEPVFQVALLDALTRLRDAQSADLARELTGAENSALRLAAARCLAVAGLPQDIAPMRQVWRDADGATRNEAGVARARHAEALLARGGNYDLAIQTLRACVNDARDLPAGAAALTALGRHGDERAVDWILAALADDPGGVLYGATVEGLAALRGRAPRERLIAALPAQDQALQGALLARVGPRRDPDYLPLMTAALAHDSVALREAARDALAASGLPEAAPHLIAAVESLESPEDRDRRRAQVLRYIDALGSEASREALGAAYLARYQLADDDSERDAALAGIRQHPIAEAYAVLTAEGGPEALAAIPSETVAHIVGAMHAGGDADGARAALDALLERPLRGESVQAALAAAGELGRLESARARLGVLHAWRLLGPIPWRVDEAFDATHLAPGDLDFAAPHVVDGEELHWTTHVSEHPWAHVDFGAVFGLKDYVTAYAYTEAIVDEAVEAALLLGSDDGARVWVNGEAVHAHHVDRGVTLDEDRVPVTLQAGRNEILIQITQRLGGWGFCARITRADGTPLDFDRMDP